MFESIEMISRGQMLARSIRISLVMLLGFMTVLTLGACGSSSSPEGVAEKAGQAYVDQDANAYYDLLAPGYAEYVAGPNGWYETEEEFVNDVVAVNIEEFHDECEDFCGTSDYHIKSVKTRVAKTCENEAMLDDVRDELANNYYYEHDEIQDVVETEIIYRVVGNESLEDRIQTINCVKVGGSWYIHQPEIDAL